MTRAILSALAVAALFMLLGRRPEPRGVPAALDDIDWLRDFRAIAPYQRHLDWRM